MTNETMTPWEKQEHQAREFIAALGELDAGGRARLKRNAGRPLAEARDIHRVFFRALPYGISRQREEDYFLIATLFPLVPHSAQAGSLGATLRQVRQLRQGGDSHSSLDRRFEALLDSDHDQLPFRLRQAVRLVASHRDGLALNWETLLIDVLRWESDNRTVQLNWARDYFVGTSPQSEEA